MITESGANKTCHIVIQGAGIIGLMCAYELSRRGASVAIVDPNLPGRGASWAAAGMLSADFETSAEDTTLFDLCHASAALWPLVAEDLETETGISMGYHPGPTLIPALSDDDWAQMQTNRSSWSRKFADSRAVSGNAALRAIEPALSANIPGGQLLRRDGQVDNRAILRGLVAALKLRGVPFTDEMPDRYDIKVDTRGWKAEGVEPVKGQLMSVTPGAGTPTHVIRSGALYIVPKRDRIIIGATSEPGQTDLETHQKDIDALRAHASRLCPALADKPMIEAWAGLRPRPLRGRPTIGRRTERHYVATGHYRNGVLLAPITAQLIADQILDDEPSPLADAFAPEPDTNPSPAA